MLIGIVFVSFLVPHTGWLKTEIVYHTHTSEGSPQGHAAQKLLGPFLAFLTRGGLWAILGVCAL